MNKKEFLKFAPYLKLCPPALAWMDNVSKDKPFEEAWNIISIPGWLTFHAEVLKIDNNLLSHMYIDIARNLIASINEKRFIDQSNELISCYDEFSKNKISSDIVIPKLTKFLKLIYELNTKNEIVAGSFIIKSFTALGIKFYEILFPIRNGAIQNSKNKEEELIERKRKYFNPEEYLNIYENIEICNIIRQTLSADLIENKIKEIPLSS